MSAGAAERGDVLVAGGGVAALRAALAAAEAGARVLLVSKGKAAASGCSAQLERGIEYCALNCGPYDEREQELLARDYLRTGMGLNRREVVEAFVAGLPAEHRFLQELALPTLAAALARPRLRWLGHRGSGGLVGARGFARDLLRALRRRAQERGVEILDRCQVLSVDRRADGVRGAMALDLRRGGIRRLSAPSVVLATGGAGGLFPLTSNPADVLGDGPVLAERCGARLRNLEFISSYPLSVGRIRRLYLIQPILMQGVCVSAGGGTWHADPVRSGDPLGLLLRVRNLCRWIEERRRAGEGSPAGGVWWDGSRIPERTYRARIPRTLAMMSRVGIDPRHERLELAPHAHQSLGGIAVDGGARTSVPGLFAAGEAAAGLHGALRLNGAGVTAALVLGAAAGRSAALHARAAGPPGPADGWSPGGSSAPAPARLRALRDQIHAVMGPLLVVRRRRDLRSAAAALAAIGEEVERMRFEPAQPAAAGLREDVRNAACAAALVVKASLRRRRALGLFLPR
jgi:succinate dehydrogenase/fumarate reductase flavoprotein subunit